MRRKKLKNGKRRGNNEKNLLALRLSMDAAHRDRASRLPEVQIGALGGAEAEGREAEAEVTPRGRHTAQASPFFNRLLGQPSAKCQHQELTLDKSPASRCSPSKRHILRFEADGCGNLSQNVDNIILIA
jgi:hypothetical protein